METKRFIKVNGTFYFGPNQVDHVGFLVIENLCIPSKLHFMVRHNMQLIEKSFCPIAYYDINKKLSHVTI